MKSKRVTEGAGNVVSVVELDPWGGETNRSSNEAFQPRKFTSYERDSIGSDEAMHRRYNRWWARFEQPDPYGGSYGIGDPQSFNRYSYVQNDPVNFVDPTGLLPSDGTCQGAECPWGGGGGGFWGGGFDMNDRRSVINPSGRETITEAEYDHDYRYLPENGPFRFQSAFQWLAIWDPAFPQDPVPQPHPTPTPRKPPSSLGNCFEGWRFSATVDHLTEGSRVNGASRVTAQILEIGPPLSLPGDAVATARKASRSGIGGTTNRYASGLTFFFRHTADSSVKGSLLKLGTRATPILSAVGAFTAGFNLAMAAQCGLGIIQ